jgi:hypothetical protein
MDSAGLRPYYSTMQSSTLPLVCPEVAAGNAESQGVANVIDLPLPDADCAHDRKSARGALTGIILGAAMWGAILMAFNVFRH